jgi:hypothetical protein
MEVLESHLQAGRRSIRGDADAGSLPILTFAGLTDMKSDGFI